MNKLEKNLFRKSPEGQLLIFLFGKKEPKMIKYDELQQKLQEMGLQHRENVVKAKQAIVDCGIGKDVPDLWIIVRNAISKKDSTWRLSDYVRECRRQMVELVIDTPLTLDLIIAVGTSKEAVEEF